MYYDLNVPLPSAAELPRTLSFLSTLGYTTLALSTSLSGKLPNQLPVPPPLPSHPGLSLLTRLTLTLSDPSANHRLSNFTSTYQILALRPTTEKLFLAACSTLECDLISLDFSQRLPFALKHKTVGAALLRGISFEVCYSAGVADVQARRNLISGVQMLLRATRGGRGIVISSEAKNVLGVRGPEDVINLAVLWGMGQEQARDAICGRMRVVVRQAESRRRGYKGVVEVVEDGERKRKAGEQGGGGKKQKDGQGGQGGEGKKMTKAEKRAAAQKVKVEVKA
ncbi:RNase P subunit p30-domain-containing protein [Pyronema domesticum]|uniref:Similar to Probable ribonuclease P protein subunit 3 acc. no. P87120 n=1 Tax=Pyronema omphalodes (strain CBS 100304) TaxID=1076935 RepID=U4LFV2_PYROM|nr:RNase P subunit p30-domain-containing protein [Pyronema domesticum]CCX10530.1 Similar to Probable ribonuclease P protein subunit 3; acc. no. P87120 [Pyronema omphalodes CBS 100304]